MTIDRYFEAILSILEKLRDEERSSIEAASEACARSIANGGIIFIHDTGHIINHELVARAGGLVGLTPFSFDLNTGQANSFRSRDPSNQPPPIGEIIALALRKANAKAGDILIIGSVSGKTFGPVELAIQAKKAGLTVIAVTSTEHSRALESEHTSGKRLFEACDIVIDNHAPPGDAILEIDGLDRKVCPASGICAVVSMWAMTAGIVEKLIAMDKIPSIYRSVNLPGGLEDVRKVEEEYAKRGY